MGFLKEIKSYLAKVKVKHWVIEKVKQKMTVKEKVRRMVICLRWARVMRMDLMMVKHLDFQAVP